MCLTIIYLQIISHNREELKTWQEFCIALLEFTNCLGLDSYIMPKPSRSNVNISKGSQACPKRREARQRLASRRFAPLQPRMKRDLSNCFPVCALFIFRRRGTGR